MDVSSLTTTPAISVTATPAVTAGAYTTGQCVGGLMTYSNAARNIPFTANGGLLQSALVTFASGVVPSMDLILFSGLPANSTFSDHVTASLAAADLPLVEGIVHITDGTVVGSTSVCQNQNAALPFLIGLTPTTLYGALVMRSAATLASTSDMQVSLQILQN